MRFDIMTLFPDMVRAVLGESIIGRGCEAGYLEIHTHQIRDYSEDKHRRVDDTPYGGGKGMLMRCEPIYACYEAVCAEGRESNGDGARPKVLYMSPKGKVLTQKRAEALAREPWIVILCGHYEGVDQRVLDEMGAEELSVGDYVLTGGELPACIVVDCVSRMVEGVLADPVCYEEESLSSGLLEYPQYTRPEVFRGRVVPAVLRGGDHAKIEEWRWREALRETVQKRPDLL